MPEAPDVEPTTNLFPAPTPIVAVSSLITNNPKLGLYDTTVAVIPPVIVIVSPVTKVPTTPITIKFFLNFKVGGVGAN